ncbi:probably inactive leucine-rich repeat receptor-like protein kinase At5g48380 isoform X2 [Vigna radiata var. radiata]|uniref:Probably inactive leucine-rich repeat receptor-like protein kinase At5g48380 isoform X2 n=1 Tax=Vigna radiata var. radiata TaxID=3916 RepID=A0A3Q0FLF9_VIGRR|nr:probably inactive leucine-rich repeat receptor-like protein kinase At5g48380 isoform X2 [Vigna radiata var. radiata]
MSTKMKPTSRNYYPLVFFGSLFCLFMARFGAESDIYCLQTIKNMDTSDLLSSWDFESNTERGICRFSGVECGNNYVEDRVISLWLSNMGLKGQFPRCIEDFTWLQTLILSHNELSGYIPNDISAKLPYLTTLDLSNNYFSGEIPKGIANLSGLITLLLDGNQLTGQIPQDLGLLPRLRDFSVANNLLEGSVPVFVSNLDVSLSYANNSGLCGGILGNCDESLFEFKKRRSNAIHPLVKKQNTEQELVFHEQGSKELSILLERFITRMSFEGLCKATDYFCIDNVLGIGKTGIMYKAKVSNSCFLAVKRLYDADKYKWKFLLEIMIPGRHRHRNIVLLHGFCIQKHERILVYKYISNGRLSDWLESDEGHQPTKLEWPERIHIALGIARGLSWLHKRCNIVHLNLDSECVLLDKNFEPKISNFGKAKFLNQTVEDHVRMKLFLVDGLGVKGNAEKDVYDFGIILFELLTGKRLSPSTDSSDSINGHMMKYISKNLFTDPADFYDAIDDSIMGKGFDDKILRLLEVACDCVKTSLKQRPKMIDIHHTLRAMWEGYKPCFHYESLKLSMDCADYIKCISQIECIE